MTEVIVDEAKCMAEDGKIETGSPAPARLRAASMVYYLNKRVGLGGLFEIPQKAEDLGLTSVYSATSGELPEIFDQNFSIVQEIQSELIDVLRRRVRHHHPVWLIHGGESDIWAQAQAALKKRGFITNEFNDRNEPLIPDRVKAMCDDCKLAVTLMTSETKEGFPRPNVCHEIGMAQGKLGFEKVVLFRQKECVLLSNVQGIVYIEFDGAFLKQGLATLVQQLDRVLGVEVAH